MSTYDQEFDDRPPPAKGGFPLWLVLVLGGVVSLFLLCGLGAMAFLVYRRDVARQEVMAMEQEVAFERDREEAERVRRQRLEVLDEQVRSDFGKNARISPPLTRDVFRTQVAGKTPDEVTASVGKPDSTEDAIGEVRWVFENRTRDPLSVKWDRRAVVVFRNGRVAEVTFE